MLISNRVWDTRWVKQIFWSVCRKVAQVPAQQLGREEFVNYFTFPHSFLQFHTFEQGAALPYRPNHSTSSKLPNRQLHEQQRDAADEERDEVWQQKNAWGKIENVTTICLNCKVIEQGNVWLRLTDKRSSHNFQHHSTHLHHFCTWCREISKRSTDRPSIRCRRARTASCCPSAGAGAWDCCLHRHPTNHNFHSRKAPRVA